MHYTLHQLKIFSTICRHESITKASEELHLTQPAVSIQLKKLQDQFEIPLTEVIGRKLYITDFGRKIEENCIRILDEAERIRTTVDQYKGLLSGKIKLSVVSTAKYVIPYFLKGFTKLHPNVEIQIDVTNKIKVLESLAANDTDFALVSVLPEELDVNTLQLMSNHLFLVSKRSNDFKDQMNASEIAKHTAIFREYGSATRVAMESYFSEKGIEPKKKLQLVSNEAVKQAVNAGLGISIMPLIGLRNELQNDQMKIINIKGLPVKTKWNLVSIKGKRLTPAATELIKHLEQTRRATIEEEFSWTHKYLDL